MLVMIAVMGPITIPKSSHLPSGTPSKPAMEIAARPGMTRYCVTSRARAASTRPISARKAQHQTNAHRTLRHLHEL